MTPLRISSQFLLLALALLVLFPATAKAQRIPPGKEKNVLDFFAPYGIDAPADRISPDAAIDSVSILPDAIRVVLVGGDGQLQLTLIMLSSASTPPWRQTGSFDVLLETENPPEPLLAAANTLVNRVHANDDGTFWNEVPPETETPTLFDRIRVEADTSFHWYDFIGEVLLLLLLISAALSSSAIRSQFPSLSRKFWLGVLLILALGGYLRLALFAEVRSEGSESPDQCIEDVQCNDHSQCTRDVCTNQQCDFLWDPPEDSKCCLADEDCGLPDDPCKRTYCNQEASRCMLVIRPECNLGPYLGHSGPSLHSSVGWLFAIPAKWSELSTRKLEGFYQASSTLSILLLILLTLVASRKPRFALALGLVWATFPPAIMNAQSGSVSNTILPLLLLFLLGLITWVRATQTHDLWRRLPPLLLAGIAFFLATTGRLESFLVLLPAWWLLAKAKPQGVRRVEWGILCGAAALSLGVALLLASLDPSILAIATLNSAIDPHATWNSAWTTLSNGAFLWGTPYFLLTVWGFYALWRTQRELFFLSAMLLLLVLLPATLFHFTSTFQAMRYSLIPCFAVVIAVAAGLVELARSKKKLLRLLLLALLIFLVVKPFTNAPQMGLLTQNGDITNHLVEW